MGCAMFYKVGLINSLICCIHLCINMELFVGEGACCTVGMSNKAHINVHLHILCKEVVFSPIGLCSKAGNFDIRIEVENTNGKHSQNSLAGLTGRSSTGERDGSRIGFLSNGIVCCKAICQYHVIKLPMVYTVEIDNGFYRLNALDFVCHEVHPINRAEGDSVKSGICGNKRKSRIGRTGLNLNNADNNRLVACIITNFKLNTVISVCNLITVCGNLAVGKGACNLNAINVNLCGRSVQAGNVIKKLLNAHSVSQSCLVSYGSREVKNIVCCSYNIAFYKRGFAIKIYLVKYRIFSIVNCFGIVYGKAIQIVCIRTVYSTVGLPQDIILCSVSNNCKEKFSLFSNLTRSVLLVELI